MELIWGAEAIAKRIGRSLRSVYHMLENDKLPGAKKIGGNWCFAPSIFEEHMKRETSRD